MHHRLRVLGALGHVEIDVGIEVVAGHTAGIDDTYAALRYAAAHCRSGITRAFKAYVIQGLEVACVQFATGRVDCQVENDGAHAAYPPSHRGIRRHCVNGKDVQIRQVKSHRI